MSYNPDKNGAIVAAAPADTPFTVGVPPNAPNADSAAALALLPGQNQYLYLIGRELGTPDAEDDFIVDAYATMKASLPTLWAMYADKQGRGIRLRYLYTKRHAVDILRGHVWQAVTNTDGIEEALTDQHKALTKMYADLTDEIALIDGAEDAARGPMVSVIARSAPIGPDYPGLQPDPNSRRLRGDPLRPGYGAYGGYGRGW